MSISSLFASSGLSLQTARDQLNKWTAASAASSSDIDTTASSALTSTPAGGDAGAVPIADSSAKPADMQAKVAALLQDQVDTGKLSADQAAELKDAFTKGTKVGHAHHGGRHMHAATPEPQEAADSANDVADSAAVPVNSSSSAVAASTDAVDSFLQGLRDKAEESANYAANGQADKSSIKSSGLVIDTLA